jgi:hypothetical protein
VWRTRGPILWSGAEFLTGAGLSCSVMLDRRETLEGYPKQYVVRRHDCFLIHVTRFQLNVFGVNVDFTVCLDRFAYKSYISKRENAISQHGLSPPSLREYVSIQNVLHLIIVLGYTRLARGSQRLCICMALCLYVYMRVCVCTFYPPLLVSGC